MMMKKRILIDPIWMFQPGVWLAAAAVFAFVVITTAQPVPPVPSGGPITNTVTLKWQPNPAVDYMNAKDTNGVPVPVTYRIRMSTDLTIPARDWPVVATTTNSQVVVSNLVASDMYFTLWSSNFFLENGPSAVVSIPFKQPSDFHLLVE